MCRTYSTEKTALSDVPHMLLFGVENHPFIVKFNFSFKNTINR